MKFMNHVIHDWDWAYDILGTCPFVLQTDLCFLRRVDPVHYRAFVWLRVVFKSGVAESNFLDKREYS